MIHDKNNNNKSITMKEGKTLKNYKNWSAEIKLVTVLNPNTKGNQDREFISRMLLVAWKYKNRFAVFLKLAFPNQHIISLRE